MVIVAWQQRLFSFLYQAAPLMVAYSYRKPAILATWFYCNFSSLLSLIFSIP